MNNKLQEFVDINEEMHRVINRVLESDAYEDDDERWKFIYDYVFSDHCSHAARDIHRFDLCDPDTTYEEDANAFIYAFDRECEKIRTLL
jgi:hypothetical protein